MIPTESILLNNFPYGVLIIDKELNISYNNNSIPMINGDFKNLKEFLSSENIKNIKKNIALKKKACNVVIYQKYINNHKFLDYIGNVRRRLKFCRKLYLSCLNRVIIVR